MTHKAHSAPTGDDFDFNGVEVTLATSSDNVVLTTRHTNTTSTHTGRSSHWELTPDEAVHLLHDLMVVVLKLEVR